MSFKFFQRMKSKEYNVRILSDNTSKKAVTRLKRKRSSAPLKMIASFALIAAAFGGAAVTSASAATVTSKQAHANVLTDLVCINGNSDDARKWSADANRYSAMGGRSAFTMNKITATTKANDIAYLGATRNSWPASQNTKKNDKNNYFNTLTGYEKYGLNYPVFDAWIPVYADKKYTFEGVSSYNGTYSNDGQVPISNVAKGNDVNDLEPGSSGLTTTSVGGCLNAFNVAGAGIANMITFPSRIITTIALELYGKSYGTSISKDGSILKPIGDAIDNIITKDGGLRDTLFVPFMIPLILIGAIWVAYMGIIKRAAVIALQSMLWMVAAIAAGTIFLAQPTLISSYLDNATAQVQSTLNDIVTVDSKGICDLGNQNKDPNKSTRELECTIWYATIFSPWVSGQFGTAITAANSANPNDSSSVLTDDPRGFLKTSTAKIDMGPSKSIQPTNWAEFQLDRQATNKSFEQSEVAFAQLSGKANFGINADWAGSPSNQISAAILMLAGTIASTAVLFVFGFALLMYQLMMVTAVLLSPFFFLFGIVPNWGRRVLMRYAELLVSVTVKRIITSLLLVVYFRFYQLITGVTSNLFLQMILVAVIALFFILSRTRFVGLFANNINFGGNKSIGLPGAKAAAVGAGIAGAGVGLALAGPLGALIGGVKGSKAAKAENQGVSPEGKMNLAGSPTADVKRPPQGGNNGGPDGNGNPTGSKLRKANDAAEAAKKANDLRKKMQNNGNGVPTNNTPPNTAPTGQTPPPASTPAQASAPTGTPTGTPTGAPYGNAYAPPAGSTAAPKGAGVPKSTGTPGGVRPVPQAAPAGAAPFPAASGGIPASGIPASGVPGAAASAAPTAGGAGAAVVPTGAASAAGSAGASAAGSAAAASTAAGAGTAAAGGVAAGAGTAAAGGVAAGAAGGAAAGSVVPVAGTIAGAALGAGAAAVKSHQQKKAAEEAEGERGTPPFPQGPQPPK
jgi:hypothetical protein